MKIIDIKEFQEKGYLQELNRQFLHPLGLALSVFIDGDGNYSLDSIWDYRDDPEGLYYNLENSSKERKDRFKKNKEYIEEQFEMFKNNRLEKLGFQIEPIE